MMKLSRQGFERWQSLSISKYYPKIHLEMIQQSRYLVIRSRLEAGTSIALPLHQNVLTID